MSETVLPDHVKNFCDQVAEAIVTHCGKRSRCLFLCQKFLEFLLEFVIHFVFKKGDPKMCWLRFQLIR